MSRWDNNFLGPKPLERVQAMLNALQSANLESITTDQRAEFERAIKVLKLLQARFSTLDAELFSQNFWSNFSTWLSNGQNQAEAASNNNLHLGHLQNLNSNLDEILNALTPIDVKFTGSDIKALADASLIYRQKLVEALDAVKKRADEVQRQFDSLSNQITNANVRLNENNDVIQQQKARLDISISEFQQQFSTAQETRNQDFLKAIALFANELKENSIAFENSFNATLNDQKKQGDAIIGQTKEQSAEHIKFLEKRKKEVDEIFGAIGSAALAGNFNDIANEERSAANFWRAVAFSFMAAMGAVAITAFYYTLTKTPDWETFLFRLGTVLVIAVPAFYAANESSKHREREKLSRKNFLELSAIDAYLVHLPAEQRNDIKGKLSDKFFGVPEIHEKSDSVSKKDLFGLLEKIIKDFTKGH